MPPPNLLFREQLGKTGITLKSRLSQTRDLGFYRLVRKPALRELGSQLARSMFAPGQKPQGCLVQRGFPIIVLSFQIRRPRPPMPRHGERVS